VATPLLLDALDPADLPTIRHVASGGDQTPPAVAARWSAVTRLTSDYGPTEGTVYSLIREGPGGAAGPPLGRPIPGARLYVLDRRLRPVPPGAVGEVALGGGCLARGYLDRPALTAARFVPDPNPP
jgi:glutamate racemase